MTVLARRRGACSGSRSGSRSPPAIGVAVLFSLVILAARARRTRARAGHDVAAVGFGVLAALAFLVFAAGVVLGVQVMLTQVGRSPAQAIVWSTRAGAPAAIESGGRSRVTTEFAPITQRSPTVTPLVMTTFAPHQTLSPIRVGPLRA